MDEKDNAVKNFLEGTENEQHNPFEDTLKDPFAQPEEREEVKEDKPLPFHKDEKIQKYLEKETRKIEQRLRESFKPSEPVQKTEDQFKEVMDSFTVVIGNDTPEKVSALNAFKKALDTLDVRAAQRAEDTLNAIHSREEAEDQAAEEELSNAFEQIEENYDVDLTGSGQRARELRSGFITYVEKIAPKDSRGQVIDFPDMNAAWETYSELRKATAQPSRAKELAARSMVRSNSTSVAQPKRIDWNAVEDHLDSLK